MSYFRVFHEQKDNIRTKVCLDGAVMSSFKLCEYVGRIAISSESMKQVDASRWIFKSTFQTAGDYEATLTDIIETEYIQEQE